MTQSSSQAKKNSGLVTASIHQWKPTLLCQDFMGHRTHANLLSNFLALEENTDASLVRFSSNDYPIIPRTLIRAFGASVRSEFVQNNRLDFFATRSMIVQGMLAKMAAKSTITRPDVLYVHGHGASGVIHGFDADVPVVLSLDGTLKAEARMRGLSRTILDKPAYALEERAFRRADLIVAFSDWARESLISDYGVPPEKAVTIRNGIRSVGEASREIAELKDTALPIIGFVGSGFHRKGGDVLLDAHQKYLADKTHLVIVTRDELHAEGGKNVTILKNVERKHLISSILPRFSIYAHPARFDWSPFSLIEALSVGLPIVATPVGSIPEMVHSGVNGYLVDVGSAQDLAERILEIVGSPQLSSAMGIASLDHFKAFYDADLNYPRLISVLRSVSRV